MTQFLPIPTHRSPPHPKHHTRSQKGGSPAALSAHTKDNRPFQAQMWPCGPLQLYPIPLRPKLLTKPVGRIPLEKGPQEALGFRAQKLGHA